MEVIDLALLGYVSGGRGNNGGDRSDNGGGNNRGKGNKNSGNNSGGFYNKYGNADCINGMLANTAKGVVGGPGGMAAGLAYGATTGGCFKDGRQGGGNVGAGPGGNKSSGSCSGKNGSGGCSW